MSSEGAREGSTQGSGVDTCGVGNGRIGMNTTGWNDDVRGGGRGGGRGGEGGHDAQRQRAVIGSK